MIKPMRATILATVVFVSGCAGYALRQQYRIPATEEGKSCARECMQVRASCGGSLRCDQQYDTCRSTCPGAEPI